MKRFLSVLLLLTLNVTAFAQLRLARLFSDHLVLQRQKPIPVWGWANPNETVKVTLANQTQSAQADASGKWLVKLNPLEAGGPHQLNVLAQSGNLTVKDILIGEVWLCSGQSNMEWRVMQADNYMNEKNDANYQQIRHFYVDHEVTMTPQTDLKTGEWVVCTPATFGNFTAVGFFFARDLYKKLNIPVGLLHSSWGGSQIEGWISREAMLTDNELKTYAQKLPDNWEAADAIHDAKTRKALLGSEEINPDAAYEKKYLEENYDISKWLNAGSPLGQWDWKGVWMFRGNGFMARNVNVPADMAGKETTLGLGIQDSPNEIYVNGQLLFKGILKGNRKIIVPANTWKAGNNRLTIKFGKMADPSWYGLGIMGSNEDLYLSAGTDKISLANEWRILPSFADNHEYLHSSNNVGTTIFNAMIAPLVPFAIRGALWYQGETNAGRAYQYRKSFPLMINDWRKQWNDEFSFYFVQLSSYGGYQNSNQGSNWGELREAQTMTLSLPKTGMAVSTDVGNPKDIHPTNKQDVGHRLALNALKFDYGQDLLHSGPMYESVKFEKGKATLSFKYTGKGLTAKDKFGYLKGFEIAGDDKVFYYAKAEIVGNKVVVFHPKGLKPVAVRYAWADAPEDANLFNADGLPASPFRTDDWKGITINGKFE
ncbi:sialate O-acetylesterase [Emticicia sp. TH156]|uniref:sialate O-acetylesterase n=1 Tax=Emticicia sp. TH156 TaxID=2067454 RepID=UPI000C794257|nr:sialate O-acetylesterase [Emticicia sp. TH156]PLK42821.1 sialate O-acetylesterase [Emticicia sp. TH156]